MHVFGSGTSQEQTKAIGQIAQGGSRVHGTPALKVCGPGMVGCSDVLFCSDVTVRRSSNIALRGL